MGKQIDDWPQSLGFQILDILYSMQHNIFVDSLPMRRSVTTFKERIQAHLQKIRSKFQKWSKLSVQQIKKKTQQEESNIQELFQNHIQLISQIAVMKWFIQEALSDQQINQQTAIMYRKLINHYQDIQVKMKKAISSIKKNQKQQKGKIHNRIQKEGIYNILDFLPKQYQQMKQKAGNLSQQYVKSRSDQTRQKLYSVLSMFKEFVIKELQLNKANQVNDFKIKVKKDILFWLKKLKFNGGEHLQLDEYLEQIQKLFK